MNELIYRPEGEGYNPTFVYNFSGSMPIKWEYKWERPGEISPAYVNNLGQRGWEWAGTLGGDWVIFKRPLPSEAGE